MYVMFPIGIMYYFGTNLDERFSVPEFWPKASEGNKVPFEKDEIHAELARLRAKRLYLRDQRLAEEKRYNEIHGIRTAEGAVGEGNEGGEADGEAADVEKKTGGWFR